MTDPKGANDKPRQVEISKEDKTDFELHCLLLQKTYGLNPADARAAAWAEGREKFNQRMGGQF